MGISSVNGVWRASNAAGWVKGQERGQSSMSYLAVEVSKYIDRHRASNEPTGESDVNATP
jgi:hypothetical protein